MTDDSLLPFDPPSVRRKKVSAAFDGGLISSDGGMVLLREAKRSLHLAETPSGCIRERRNQAQVVHPLSVKPALRWHFPVQPRYNPTMIEPVARVRIELQSVTPTVWRRVDVPLSCTLAALHDVIQIAMGWTDSHLHEFTVGKRVYGMADAGYDLDDDRKVYKDSSIRLKTVIERGFDRFRYLYDFGDHWEHEVIVEDVRDGEDGIDYPAFVEGARRCPPEDVGAARGFMSFLEAALDPAHEEHRSMIEWYGGPYDPADIDERLVRMSLETMARARRGALASHRRGGRRGRTGELR